MTFAEFKAWFDGFTEAMDGPPNAEQWTRIKARIGEIKQAAPTPVATPNWAPRWNEWTFPLTVRGAASVGLDDGDGGMTKRAAETLKG
jgi:hypothetical protein